MNTIILGEEKDFELVACKNDQIGQFALDVNEMLKKGYMLYGPTFSNNDYIYQSMVKSRVKRVLTESYA